MQSVITRLALFQFLAIVYCTLGIGVILKLVHGSPAPVIFATHLRNYGFLLLLLPALWLMWASISAHRPLAGTGELSPVLASGITLLGLLLLVGAIATCSAFVNGARVEPVPASQSAAR